MRHRSELEDVSVLESGLGDRSRFCCKEDLLGVLQHLVVLLARGREEESAHESSLDKIERFVLKKRKFNFAFNLALVWSSCHLS